MAADDWIIERLAKHHDRSIFQCGQPMLDEWLQQRSSQYDRRDLARTYVAVRQGEALRQGEAVVRGYYALANHRVSYGAERRGRGSGPNGSAVPARPLAMAVVERPTI